MQITVYMTNGIRKYYYTAHEVLEHNDETTSITYTDTREGVYKSDRIKNIDFERMVCLP